MFACLNACICFYAVFARVCVCEVFLDLTQPTVRTDSYNTADQSCLQVDHLLSFCAALHVAKTLSTVISEEARFVLAFFFFFKRKKSPKGLPHF